MQITDKAVKRSTNVMLINVCAAPSKRSSSACSSMASSCVTIPTAPGWLGTRREACSSPAAFGLPTSILYISGGDYTSQGGWADTERLFSSASWVFAATWGPLSEEYDLLQRQLVGNFPQAFSHVALINGAFPLTTAQMPIEQPSQHVGASVAKGQHGPINSRSQPLRGGYWLSVAIPMPVTPVGVVLVIPVRLVVVAIIPMPVVGCAELEGEARAAKV